MIGNALVTRRAASTGKPKRRKRRLRIDTRWSRTGRHPADRPCHGRKTKLYLALSLRLLDLTRTTRAIAATTQSEIEKVNRTNLRQRFAAPPPHRPLMRATNSPA